MAALIDGPLAKHRERLNARVAAARLSGRTIEAAALGAHLSAAVAPAVSAVHALDEAAAERAALALFELSVDLLGAGLVGPGARTRAVSDAWTAILPAAGRVLKSEPRRVAGAVTNAALQVEAHAPAHVAGWIADFARQVPHANDLEAFRAIGRVAAWRAGLAHLREAAEGDCARLEPSLVSDLLGVDPGEARWPREPLLVGAFRGFGGLFARPPLVAVVGGRLVAVSGDVAFTLFADRFGATLLPLRGAAPELPAAKPRELARRFPDLLEPVSAAALGPIVAVTLRHSHRILVRPA